MTKFEITLSFWSSKLWKIGFVSFGIVFFFFTFVWNFSFMILKLLEFSGVGLSWFFIYLFLWTQKGYRHSIVMEIESRFDSSEVRATWHTLLHMRSVESLTCIQVLLLAKLDCTLRWIFSNFAVHIHLAVYWKRILEKSLLIFFKLWNRPNMSKMRIQSVAPHMCSGNFHKFLQFVICVCDAFPKWNQQQCIVDSPKNLLFVNNSKVN